jgi:hypothetical protein
MLHGDYYCLPPNKCDLLNDPLITWVIYKQLGTAGLAKHDSDPNVLHWWACYGDVFGL